VSVTLAAWRSMWAALGADHADEAVFHSLVAAWSQAHRHYHTLQHLRECLDHLDAVRGQASRPAEIELALWFHDGFYDPRRGDNEQRSADWARQALASAGAGPDVADRVHAMVMATSDHAHSPEGDTQLLLDIDLAILGCAADRFDESDLQIRAEYAHVLPGQWREGRGGVLRRFMDRPRIFQTRHFHDRFEGQARANLQRALQGLQAGR
jgi:predicted metal-dependent HD superfamily phosphohydrolase